MKSKLHTFLAKHGSVNKFKRAVETPACKSDYTVDELYIAGDMDADVIQYAFLWYRSHEGHDYWASLDDKYQSEFNS